MPPDDTDEIQQDDSIDSEDQQSKEKRPPLPLWWKEGVSQGESKGNPGTEAETSTRDPGAFEWRENRIHKIRDDYT